MSRTQAFLWLMKLRGNIWPIFVTDSKRQRQNQMFSTIRCKLKWKLLSFMPSIKSASDSQLAVDFLNIYFKFVSLFINFKKKIVFRTSAIQSFWKLTIGIAEEDGMSMCVILQNPIELALR